MRKKMKSYYNNLAYGRKKAYRPGNIRPINL